MAEDNDYELDEESKAEIARIEAMTPEEVHAELIALGYTDERIQQTVDKVKAMVDAKLEEWRKAGVLK